MSDMSTFEGQTAHYAEVRSRLWNAPLRLTPPTETIRRIRVPPAPSRFTLWLVKAKEPPAPPKEPVVILTPPEVTEAIVRDVLFLASPEFIDPGQWEVIVKEVAAKHRITIHEIRGQQRSRNIVAARHEAFYRLAHETTMSLPAIGRRLGNRDHTTVIHGIRKHAEREGLVPSKGGIRGREEA